MRSQVSMYFLQEGLFEGDLTVPMLKLEYPAPIPSV